MWQIIYKLIYLSFSNRNSGILNTLFSNTAYNDYNFQARKSIPYIFYDNCFSTYILFKSKHIKNKLKRPLQRIIQFKLIIEKNTTFIELEQEKITLKKFCNTKLKSKINWNKRIEITGFKNI